MSKIREFVSSLDEKELNSFGKLISLMGQQIEITVTMNLSESAALKSAAQGLLSFIDKMQYPDYFESLESAIVKLEQAVANE